MEKRIINSFGGVTIPVGIRKELGIDGNVGVWIDVREMSNGEKEIVIRRSNSAEEAIKRYQKWTEILARITECSVSLVWNGKVLLMSAPQFTESFLDKNLSVSPLLLAKFKGVPFGGVQLAEPIPFLPSGSGQVAAFYRAANTGDDSCFFVVLKGTKFMGSKISKAEEARRFSIVNDILSKI